MKFGESSLHFSSEHCPRRVYRNIQIRRTIQFLMHFLSIWKLGLSSTGWTQTEWWYDLLSSGMLRSVSSKSDMAAGRTRESLAGKAFAWSDLIPYLTQFLRSRLTDRSDNGGSNTPETSVNFYKTMVKRPRRQLPWEPEIQHGLCLRTRWCETEATNKHPVMQRCSKHCKGEHHPLQCCFTTVTALYLTNE
jgi:hypothetical protein